MYYILVIDGVAHESIPEYDSAFPDVPITDRYSPDILSKCVQSDTIIACGWLYDAETGTFSEPVIDGPGTIVDPETGKTITLEDTVRAQNATITIMASVIQDLQSDVEALKI